MKKLLPLFVTTILLCALAFASIWAPIAHVSGAPVAAPTPVAAVARGLAAPQLFTLFNNKAVTPDTTTPCIDVADYDVVDLYYSINQSTTNTTTLKLQFGNSETVLVDGLTIASANTSDTSAIQQFQTFGKYMCVLADVANSNTITFTVNMLAK
jgi:hypothetical protein